MIKFIKAKFILLSVFFAWLFFIVVMTPLIVPVTVAAIWVKPLRGYRYKLWIAQDQMVNAIHNGNPDVTVSSMVGYMAYNGSKTAKVMEAIIDWLFYVAIGQENHCYQSIEWDRDHTL
jgi:hypothetical protein